MLSREVEFDIIRRHECSALVVVYLHGNHVYRSAGCTGTSGFRGGNDVDFLVGGLWLEYVEWRMSVLFQVLYPFFLDFGYLVTSCGLGTFCLVLGKLILQTTRCTGNASKHTLAFEKRVAICVNRLVQAIRNLVIGCENFEVNLGGLNRVDCAVETGECRGRDVY